MGPRARATSVRTYYAFFAMQFQARADRAMAMAEAKSRGTAAELSEMWAYGRRETAAPGRIEAAIARARAAGVAGLEAYDAAWVAKSLRQGECHDVVDAKPRSGLCCQKTRFRESGAANDSQKSNKRGPRERGRRGNAGKWAPAPLEAAGGAPPPKKDLRRRVCGGRHNKHRPKRTKK